MQADVTGCSAASVTWLGKHKWLFGLLCVSMCVPSFFFNSMLFGMKKRSSVLQYVFSPTNTKKVFTFFFFFFLPPGGVFSLCLARSGVSLRAWCEYGSRKSGFKSQSMISKATRTPRQNTAVSVILSFVSASRSWTVEIRCSRYKVTQQECVGVPAGSLNTSHWHEWLFFLSQVSEFFAGLYVTSLCW